MIETDLGKIAIVVVSKGRYPDTKTTKWLDDERVYLSVSESEERLYNFGKCQKLIHPDNVIGLYPKIDWVWNYFRGKVDCVIKVDDDIKWVRDNGAYYYQDKNIMSKAKLGKEEFLGAIRNLYYMSKDLGVYIFGFGACSNWHQYSAKDRFKFIKAFDTSIFGYIYEDKIKISYEVSD